MQNQKEPCLSRITFNCLLLIYLTVMFQVNSVTPYNVCTFQTGGDWFTMTALNRVTSGKHYEINIHQNITDYRIVFDFCVPFVPTYCPNTTLKAFSFVVVNTTNGEIECHRYSSDSQTSYYNATSMDHNGQISLNLTLLKEPEVETNKSQKRTQFILECTSDVQLTNYALQQANYGSKLVIIGKTASACPVFQISSLWKALADSSVIFGIILFALGFVMLFYGILMTHLMIFITSYFISFAIIGGIFTAFLGPESSTLAIYFSLLFILFLSTLFAYGLTRLVNVSIFFIGAFFGFILGALINTIFCEIFKVYSMWSLIVIQVICVIPFGLLTFKYSKEVIIMSTSLTGAYLIVRPISWIFGGFPNEFTFYKMVQSGEIPELPWTFFLYLVFIIALAILGALYQELKKKRQDEPGIEIDKSFLTENVEDHLDKIKQAVDKMMNHYAPPDDPVDPKLEPLNSGTQLQDVNQNKTTAGRNQNF